MPYDGLASSQGSSETGTDLSSDSGSRERQEVASDFGQVWCQEVVLQQ